MFAQQSQKSENHTAQLLFGSTKKRKVMTQLNVDQTFWEILFQKVALGYVLHFVQNGSSNNILKTHVLHKSNKHQTIF